MGNKFSPPPTAARSRSWRVSRAGRTNKRCAVSAELSEAAQTSAKAFAPAHRLCSAPIPAAGSCSAGSLPRRRGLRAPETVTC
eukprot:4011454-Pyramimonas_sp.AAC.1